MTVSTTSLLPPAPQPSCRCRSDSLQFGPSPGAAALARLHTRVVLDAWDLGELTVEAAQIVSELVTNAIEAHRREHLNAPVRLTLLAGLRTVLIVVRDAAGSMPQRGVPDETSEHGRGLFIVDALADRWDCKIRRDGGKTVRALLRGERHD